MKLVDGRFFLFLFNSNIVAKGNVDEKELHGRAGRSGKVEFHFVCDNHT